MLRELNAPEIESFGGAEITSAVAIAPTKNVYKTPAFWERLWRASGVNALVFFIAAYFIYGYQPHPGAPAGELVSFYTGERTRILIAAVINGMAILNLLWFASALKTTLSDAGQ